MVTSAQGLIRLHWFWVWAVMLLITGDLSAQVHSVWRVTVERPAPWTTRPAEGSNHVGRTVRFRATQVSGPGVVVCEHAHMESTLVPLAGLFQGNLPPPIDSSAWSLGLGMEPVKGFRLTCSAGSYEFHHADADTLLLGLDNRVLTLSRSFGTSADARSPEGRVQRLLEAHFAGDMGFSPQGVHAKAHWLTSRLHKHLIGYLSEPGPTDQAPDINGDPFTDTQEYPTRFAVGQATWITEGAVQLADVPVRFADAHRSHTLVYRMRKEEGEWRLDGICHSHPCRVFTLGKSEDPPVRKGAG